MVQTKIKQWISTCTPHYTTTYFYSPISNHIYEKINNSYKSYAPRSYKRRHLHNCFDVNGKDTIVEDGILTSLQPINVAHYRSYTQKLCVNNINQHGQSTDLATHTDLYALYHKLPKTLKRLVGEITIPQDDKTALIQHLKHANLPLIGMSDASLKNGYCGHS